MMSGIFLTERIYWWNVRPSDNKKYFPSLCTQRQDSTPAVLRNNELPFTKTVYFSAFSSVCPDMVTLYYPTSPGRNISFSPYFIHIIRICKLFCMTDEDCEMKQLVPPVSLQEPTAMRYNRDDITREEVGQIHGHLKTEYQLFFLLQ